MDKPKEPDYDKPSTFPQYDADLLKKVRAEYVRRLQNYVAWLEDQLHFYQVMCQDLAEELEELGGK